MSRGEELLDRAQEAVKKALSLGADEAEVIAVHEREVRVDLQKSDIQNASVAEESTFGIRVFRNNSLGFATVNHPDAIQQACEEALALAKVSPPDESNGLVDAPSGTIEPLEHGADPAIAAMDITQCVELASSCLQRMQDKDSRVVTDSGYVGADVGTRALASSKGVGLHEDYALCGGSFFGMAVDGSEVGSFDYDGQTCNTAEHFEKELNDAADRFVIKALGALGGGAGESFRGPIILSPEVVTDFVLGNLLATLSAKAVRTGKSPFADKMGQAIVSPMIQIEDDPRLKGGVASSSFDREGTPTQARTLVEDGVLKGFLYDGYEARRAGVAPTGNARGGASSMPGIGSSNVRLRPGDQSFTRLCCDPKKAVVVSRFSGSCNPITGEFSGVVKGGFLMSAGEKRAIKETLIAGNLWDSLKNISGMSEEVRIIGGSRHVCALRLEDISITAG